MIAKGGGGMRYMTAQEAAERWGVSLRQVQRLAAEQRIPGAQAFGRAWMIPLGAEKPADLRRDKPHPCVLSAELLGLFASTAGPLPASGPDAILETLGEDRLRLIYEAEICYQRGDFERVMACYQNVARDDAARLRISLGAIAAAISTGDYRAYTEIEGWLKRIVETTADETVRVFAELGLATAAVSVAAPNLVPEWLREGDLGALPPAVRPYALYLRSKYFLCLGQFQTMLAVAQTAQSVCAPEKGIAPYDIYLRMMCAVSCHNLERDEEARRWLLDACRIALPHDLITPFAEHVTLFGGLMEQVLAQEFPDCYERVLKQWKRTWRNWITFHNRFTKDNITLILSLREYHFALQVARRVPHAKIARQYGISVGRFRNIMREIYEKLSISGPRELKKYIL